MIRSFYQNRTLLLTGGTGFVGQALCAKLLRDVPGLRRIYMLVRPRRRPDGSEVPPAVRLEEEFFASSVFEAFRRDDPAGFAACRAKVAAVPFRIGDADLGLAPADAEILRAEVDTFVNSAATVVFDEPLDVSLRLNTQWPLDLLGFSRTCRKPVVFVHVSTAYVNGQLPGLIPEEPLSVDRTIRQLIEGGGVFDPLAEIEACRAYCNKIERDSQEKRLRERFRRDIRRQSSFKLTENRLEQMVEDRARRWRERLLVAEGMRRAKEYGWNDVYTFTKAMGEQMLVKERGDTPLAIVRPSIIESSLTFPEPGWITGLKVTDPLIAAYGRGMIPDFPARPHMVIDLIPVDYVANAIVAAAPSATADQVKVYQVATSAANPIRLSQLFDYVRGYFQRHPMLDRKGNAPDLPQWSYPSLRKFHAFFRLRYLWPLGGLEWIYGRLPSALVSAQKKRLVSTLKVRLQRVLYYTDIYHPYTHLSCSYSMEKTRALLDGAPAEERRLFDLDVGRLDWEDYVGAVHIPGLRRHVLKDEAETLFKEAPGEGGAEEQRWQAASEIQTLPELYKWAAARHAVRIAWQVKRRGAWERYTYAEAFARAEEVAGRLHRQGVGAGDRVVLVGDNKPEWLVHLMAVGLLGAVAVPLDPHLPADEFLTLLRFAKVRAVLASRRAGRRLLDEIGPAGGEVVWCDLDRWGCLWDGEENEGKEAPPAVQVGADDTAMILFTSGGGRPRGVSLSHRNLLADLLALSEVQRVYEGDQILSLLPLHLGLELTGGALMGMWAGATTTYLGALNSRDILATMSETGTTAMLSVPRLLKVLVDRIQRTGQGAVAFERLRLLVCGGAPLPLELYDRYREMGVALYEGYGLSEAGPVVAVNPPDEARRGSVGRPLPGIEIRLSPEGEVLVRGPNVFQGYCEDEEGSRRVLREGWLHTGDLGRLDNDGFLYIEGRRKDLIVTGAGKNVYPEDIELAYGALPGVAEVGVTGVPSPRTAGEEVHGVAVLERDGIDEAEVRRTAYAIGRLLPGYRRISRLHLTRRPLPRDDEGTVDRSALAAGIALEVSADTGDGLEDWERRVVTLVSAVCGLAPAEVAAHREAPLDTLLDSLMAVELGVRLEEAWGVEVGNIDRAEGTLQKILDAAEAKVGGSGSVTPSVAAEEKPYWKSVAEACPQPRNGKGRKWGGGLARACLRAYYPLETYGEDTLPQDRPYLLAANHASYLDPLALLAAAGGRIKMLNLAVARHRLDRSPWRDWWIRRVVRTIPFDRPDAMRESLLSLARGFGPGCPLLVFPEGRRAEDGRLLPFKSGIGMLALELDLPVVPVRIDGTAAAWPREGGMRRGPLRVGFGEAVEPPVPDARIRYELYREVAEEVRRRIKAMA